MEDESSIQTTGDSDPGKELSDKILHPRQRAMLAAYMRTHHIGKATEAAGIHRTTHYDWLWTDPDYAAAFARARTIAGDILEDEAVHRAVEGDPEPVYQGKEYVGDIVRKSDALLIVLLRGAKPDIYGRPGTPRKQINIGQQNNQQQINIGQAPPGSGMTPDPALAGEIEARRAEVRRALVEAIQGGPLVATAKTVEARPAADNGNGSGGNGTH